MFGRELAKGKVSIKGKIFFSIFGHDHIGLRIRAMHVQKAIKSIAHPDKILDAGSGQGCYSFYFARKYTNARVISMDINEDNIENSKMIAIRSSLQNIVFYRGSLVRYNHENNFDLICCIDVLEHIDDDDKVLRNFRNMLKKDGKLLVHVPMKRSLRPHYVKELPEEADHVRYGYTEEEIVHKLKKTQFSILQIKYTFGKYGSLARELSQIIEESGSLKIILKGLLLPLLISLAYFDTLSKNHQHGGLMLICT